MKALFFILILLILFSCTNKNRNHSISVEKLRLILRDNPNSILIDVRTTGEFNGPLYHIDGAKSIPLADLYENIVDLKKNKEKQYYIICF